MASQWTDTLPPITCGYIVVNEADQVGGFPHCCVFVQVHSDDSFLYGFAPGGLTGALHGSAQV